MTRVNSFILHVLICLVLTVPVKCNAQSIIKGVVKDVKGTPISYVNVFIKNSTDGTITDSTFSFKIVTKLQGSQVINVSYILHQCPWSIPAKPF
jgi:hypothetical protein